jgi:hypothetical protein
MLDGVVVAPTVRTLLTSAEVVPIATLSVWVVSLTNVPSSVQPEAPPPESSVSQMMFPDASVARARVLLQLSTVDSCTPPALTSIPPAKVEVPVPWEMICPPVKTRPLAEASPPAKSPDDIPPAKVEVAVEEALRFPKRVVRPETWRVEEAARFPPTFKVETAVEDACERKPEPNVVSPERVEAPSTVRVLKSLVAPVACNVEEAARLPETVKGAFTVEEAVAMKPPEGFSLNTVDEAIS